MAMKRKKYSRGCGGDERVGDSLVSGGARCRDQCMQLARREKQLQNADNGDNVRCSMAIGLARGFG